MRSIAAGTIQPENLTNHIENEIAQLSSKKFHGNACLFPV
jgi:hypothetical protein